MTTAESRDDATPADDPAATVVLDDRFVIRAVNRAYTEATRRSHDALVGRHILEAFPDNPEDPDGSGADRLERSLHKVIESGQPDDMWVLRYDITDPADGSWMRRYWVPTSLPVHDHGRVVGVAVRVEDVTPQEEGLQQVLDLYNEMLTARAVTDRQARRFVESARAFVAAAGETRKLSQEVAQLRRALTTRATIDQAKGIVMAEHGGSPEEAFALIKKMSSDTNVRVADVAAALVYRAQHGTLR